MFHVEHLPIYMQIGNFHFGFINDKSVTIREVVLNPALEAFDDFEAISQILAKIQGGLESVNVYANDGNSLFGLTEDEVRRFIKRSAFAIYVTEMIEGRAFLGVTENGRLYLSDDDTPYIVADVMYERFGVIRSMMIRHAVEHYQKTIGADFEVLSHSGFEGLVTPQTNTIDGGFADDAITEELQSRLNRNGLQAGQQKYLVTNLPFQIMQPKNELATLDFTAKQKQTFLTLCDKFGCPKELFAIADNSTYENRRLAKVDFYQNTIFPYLDKVLDVINRINEDITGKADIFYLAKSEVPEVAYEERNAKIAAQKGTEALCELYKLGIITADEVRANVADYFYLNNEKK